MSDYEDDDNGGYAEEAYEEYEERREEEEEEEEEKEEEEEEEEEDRGSGSGSDHDEQEDRPYYEHERDEYAGNNYPGASTRAYGDNDGYPGAQYGGGYGGGYEQSHGDGHGSALGGMLAGGLLGGALGAAASKFGKSSGGGGHGDSYQAQQNYPPSGNYQSQGNYDQGYRGAAPPPPPEGKVQFGHGAPAEYAFSYSNCTGKRKALLVGINYFGQSGQLSGCINDVHNVSGYLIEKFGYQRQDMVILTDDQQTQSGQPTKQNILRAMRWLVDGAQPNDSLFFHYSGHGGSTDDLNGDEDDGKDEVIYPVDYNEAGHIVDDDMHAILVNPLQAGVRLTCIFDSCHSGSALDLPYMYSTSGVIKEPNLAKEAGQGLLNVFTSANAGDYGSAAGHVFNFFKKATLSDDAREKTIATKTSPADVIMWSGSKDDQTSADATINSQATGAMSWAFISAMKKNPQQSYVQLLNSIRDVLETKYTQKPQLSASHPIDTDLLFIM